MGKKPVFGIVSALCVGLALTGCRNCSSCQSDSARVAKNNPPAFQPHPTFQTNSAAAAPATTGQGWNNTSGTPFAKTPSPATADAAAPVGLDKSAPKPAEPIATTKPASADVQPTGFVPPPPMGPDMTPPAEVNTSHFPPTAAGRILPSPPALATGSTLPPLGDEHPFPQKVEESTALPLPPPPPPPSLSHTPSNDPAPSAPGTLPSPAPSAPLAPGTLPPPPPPPGPNG